MPLPALFLAPTSENEMTSVMNKLDYKTSKGPCGISIKLFKLVALAIGTPFDTLINRYFRECFFTHASASSNNSNIKKMTQMTFQI